MLSLLALMETPRTGESKAHAACYRHGIGAMPALSFPAMGCRCHKTVAPAPQIRRK
jgi:hypothetical protein